ncbi:calcium-binding protein [Aquabacterium humicola]|uniref:calcium-binding protein n=1 Tax=Aquabacterium humicola TaxID=3237377 RepID=UPI002542F81A|nr:hypothetical protein [Rubrivivax pictus]
MSFTATFTDGVLAIAGDALDNPLTVGRDAAGKLFVNGSAIPVAGVQPTIANTTLIQVFGQDGNDSVLLSEVNGPLPHGQLFGGAGHDTLTGGAGSDMLFGQLDNDVLRGLGGDDFLFGGVGNDLLIGGTGHDELYGEAGDDRLVWNNGDGSDLFEGGDGFDIAEVNGGSEAEVFTVTANGTRVRIDRIDPAPFFIDAGTMEKLQLALGGGDDQFFATGNLAALLQITVDGGAGNDLIHGSNGADVLKGGDGDDTLDGNQGNDSLFLGAGNDRFSWDPGDGSDVIEGGSGTDVLQLNGSAIYEQFVLGANGARLRLTRDIGSIVLDADDVETVEIRALGGTDRITVEPLAGTDVRDVRVDLTAFGGGGDGAVDVVAVHGTTGADVVSFSVANGVTTVLGLTTRVHVSGAEQGSDVLQLVLGEGGDVLTGAGLVAGTAYLAVDGGAGNDKLTGSASADTLAGGDGTDLLTGGLGDDWLYGDAGDDRIQWTAGDGNDLVDGGEGFDVVVVDGSGLADKVIVTANGERVRVDLTEPAPAGSLDIGTTEEVRIELNAGDDQFFAVGNLAALTTLVIDGGSGNDVLNGGNGADVLIGGDGNDLIDGNQGSDSVLMGAGNDRFAWSPGDGSDVIEGGSGADVMQVDGSAIQEQYVLSAGGANGTRLRMTRDIANVVFDADDVETVELRTFGGADLVTVESLAATDVRDVRIDLALLGGAGDAASDVVAVKATDVADVVSFGFANGIATVLGLATRVHVGGAEAALDSLQLRLLDGHDVLSGAGLGAGAARLVADGGLGNDRLTGSANGDTLIGGAGNDELNGAVGDDVIDGGEGDDLLLWKAGDGNDVFDGGAGLDLARVSGSAAADTFTVTANGERVRIDRLEPLPAGSIDLGTTEQLRLELGGGDDRFFATGNLAALVQLTIDGGAGNDVINGGNGADVLGGGDGNDTIDGNQGADSIFLGAGNDRFSWDPGDGSDVIEGGSGTDVLAFNGSAIYEQLVLSANGARLKLTRDIAGITLDADDIETVELRPVGGTDRITVNHLGGTDVKAVRIDLAPTLGGSGGDGVADTVVIDGSAGNDVVAIFMENGALVVRGLGYDVVVRNFEPGLDKLQFNGLAGDDVVKASVAVLMPLVLDGGDGNDVLTGGGGDDWLDGGAGFDTLTGGPGVDVLLNGEVQIAGLPSGIDASLIG